MSHLTIFQNNINGFYSKSQLLELNLHNEQPHVCLIQEGFRSKPKNTEHHFQYMYNNYWSETGRTGIFCRRDLHSTQRLLNPFQNKFESFGYESCWVEISCPGETKPILFCSFYRNIQRTSIKYEDSIMELDEKEHQIPSFDLTEFEKELRKAQEITKNIIIGGDWNAHHPAWLDKNTDSIAEYVLDFIFNNNLHILNDYPFNCTFNKDGVSSCIDITLCSSSILNVFSNWRTDNLNLDVESDHLPITFNILANWSTSNIRR